MNKKALFFDVDGTLIDDKTKEVPQTAIKALKKARENGHLIFINSGRVACLLDDIQEIFDVDGIIAGCGTHIVLGDETIFEHRISLKRCNEIRDNIKKYGMTGILEAKERLYMPKRPFEYAKFMDRIYNVVSSLCEVRLDAMEDNSVIFDKFCIVSDKDKKNDNLNNFIETVQDFDIIDRSRGFYECVPLSCSKGKAIDIILDKLDIDPENAYVFGDSMNDLTMFTCKAKHKILMEKHDEQLEKYATFMTKSVLDNGIEYAMKNLGII